MRFGARHQFVDRAVGRIFRHPVLQRLRRQGGRPENGVKPPGDQRYGQHGCHAGGALSCPVGCGCRCRRVAEPQDAASDLGAGLFGLGSADQAAGGVPVDFGELVAIDFQVVAPPGILRSPAAHQGQQHRHAGSQCQKRG